MERDCGRQEDFRFSHELVLILPPMVKPCLLAFVDDLFLKSSIDGIAEAKDIDVYFATQGEQLSQLAKTIVPFMLVVDLSGPDSEWLFRHIGEIGYIHPNLPILGFISRVQDDVRTRAEKYGCRAVLTKVDLTKKLPEAIERALGGAL